MPVSPITRLVGAILLEQTGERVARRSRRIALKGIVGIGDDPLVSPPVEAA